MEKSFLKLVCLATILPGVANAEIPSDDHMQSNRLYSANVDHTNTYAIAEVVTMAHLRYLESLLEREYPLRSIYLHATATGISISDAAYLLTLTEPEQAEDIYSVAVDLLPKMPGWVCGQEPDLDIRYPVFYPASSLGNQPSVSEVATRFFEKGTQIGYRASAADQWGFPDPAKQQFHFKADIDELLELARAEIQTTGYDNWWYQPGDGTPLPGENGVPVFISLYKFDRSYAIDATVERLEAIRATGTRNVPVIIVFNNSYSLPVSRSCRYDANTGASNQAPHIPEEELSIKQVASNYFDCRRTVTPPREWQMGDFHFRADTREIIDTFGIPTPQEIDSKRWEDLKQELSSGKFTPPVKITFNMDGKLMWATDRDKIAAAASLGYEKIPVVFFFHEVALSRGICNSVPNCDDAVCRAVVAGGASFTESDCDQVYQAWLANQGTRSESTQTSTERTSVGTQDAETVDLLRKAAEQIK